MWTDRLQQIWLLAKRQTAAEKAIVQSAASVGAAFSIDLEALCMIHA
jgi:hypothetical protein